MFQGFLFRMPQVSRVIPDSLKSRWGRRANNNRTIRIPKTPRCATRWQIENICVNYLRSLEATKVTGNGHNYFVLNHSMVKVDAFESFIDGWIRTTSARGIVTSRGKGGGTMAHPEIAMASRAWLFPEFMNESAKQMMRSLMGEERIHQLDRNSKD